MLLLVISKVIYADMSFTEQEIPKVIANNGYEFTIPYFELETPFGITAYKVKLIAPLGQLTFSVDSSTLEIVPIKQRTDIPVSTDQPPIPSFTVTGGVFDASNSYHDGGIISNYEWLVNDKVAISTSSPIVYDDYYCSVFLSSDYYQIELIMTDNQGGQNILEQTIYIKRAEKLRCASDATPISFN